MNSRSNNRIEISGMQLNEVSKYMYTYLRANVSNQGGGGEDMNNRLWKAMGSFMKLKSIWNSNKFSLKTKLRGHNWVHFTHRL